MPSIICARTASSIPPPQAPPRRLWTYELTPTLASIRIHSAMGVSKICMLGYAAMVSATLLRSDPACFRRQVHTKPSGTCMSRLPGWRTTRARLTNFASDSAAPTSLALPFKHQASGCFSRGFLKWGQFSVACVHRTCRRSPCPAKAPQPGPLGWLFTGVHIGAMAGDPVKDDFTMAKALRSEGRWTTRWVGCSILNIELDLLGANDFPALLRGETASTSTLLHSPAEVLHSPLSWEGSAIWANQRLVGDRTGGASLSSYEGLPLIQPSGAHEIPNLAVFGVMPLDKLLLLSTASRQAFCC